MSTILIIAGLLLTVASVAGYLSIPWWIGLAVAGAGIAIRLFSSLFGALDASLAPSMTNSAGQTVNQCGCKPGQLVAIGRPRKVKQTLPCPQAMSRLAQKRSWKIHYCTDM
jgi:hypothetical protein